MTLREEINHIINGTKFFREALANETDDVTVDILKLFEKLIDSKIQYYNKTYKTTNIGNWLNNPVKIEALKDLKELLKQ